MACTCALPSACILCRQGFDVAPCASPLQRLASAHALPLAHVLCPLQLCHCCACVALVLCRCSKWRSLPLRLCHCCYCFAVAANGLHSRFAISLRSLPLRLCRCCTCIALVLCCRGKWLALALCLQLAFFVLAASPLRLCHRCLCFAVKANGSCVRFAVSLGYIAVACSMTPRLCFDLAAPALPLLCAWPLP